MMDIFEEVRDILGLEYVSDLRFYKNKERIFEILKELPDSRVSQEQKEKFLQYVMGRR